jgi:hypothetical protein
LSGDEFKERILLLRRYLYHLEWPMPNEVRTKVSQQIFNSQLPIDQAVNLEKLAKIITDEQLTKMVQLSPFKDHYSFKGKYYTVKEGTLKCQGSWEEVKITIKQVLKIHGKKGYALLKALVETGQAHLDSLAARASEVYGDKLYPTHLIAEFRDRFYLAWEVGSKQQPRWAMPEEIKPVVIEVLSEFEAKPVPRLSTEQAEREFLEVIRMDEDFRNYLKDLIANRLEETIEFGKQMSPTYLINYLQSLYGPTIFFDHLLSITQSYSICDSIVINKEGQKALSTGFNLALFGEPGTGKTFATKDMILGNEDQGVPAHGLPGINRYCGGMTPAMFIAIGEAYVGRRFNFIVTEFNDWFKHKGMVEPLKLAMERGTIRYETKTYTVGPYRFASFFTVNYNTQVYEKGYEVTVRDTNFNAIEDRMLCRLHRLTKQKYQELAKSQRALILGELKAKMEQAYKIRDHLALVYAIQTKDPLVAGSFYDKKIQITDEILKMLEDATNLVLEHLGSVKVIPFSMRLERRALQLASAMTLMNYFNTDSDIIPIDSLAARMAVQFFLEEAWIRSNEAFPIYHVMKKLATPSTESAREMVEAGQKASSPTSLESKTQAAKEVAEPKKSYEYTEDELPEDLRSVGLGMYQDSLGNIWDYRIGPDGKRLYSVRSKT